MLWNEVSIRIEKTIVNNYILRKRGSASTSCLDTLIHFSFTSGLLNIASAPFRNLSNCKNAYPTNRGGSQHNIGIMSKFLK
jgi:hypothetical protein